MRLFSLIALLILSQVTVAAENDEPAQDTDQTELAQDSPEIMQGDADDPAETEESDEETSVRFIPTEQISQDLGVSFPVDI